MHYYQFNIGDYRRDTSHLSLLEHGIYRTLIDTYYLNQQPLCGDDADIMRTHCIRSAEEKEALKNVLKDFFKKTKKGYVHKKCEDQIKKFISKSEKARASAKLRWDANALRTHCERNANHKPITNNHKQIKESENKFSDDDMKAALFLFAKIKQLIPKSKKPNLDNWANTIRLMRERDGRTHKEICEVFKFANNHTFWQSNILSPDKLRKKFDTIELQSKNRSGGWDEL